MMKMILADAPPHFHSQKFYRLAPMRNKHVPIVVMFSELL